MFYARGARGGAEQKGHVPPTWTILLVAAASFNVSRQAYSQLTNPAPLGRLHTTAGSVAAIDPLVLPPKQWAVEAARNEVSAIQYGSAYMRYHVHSSNAKGDQLRDVVESKDGAVARMILKDNRQLTAQEDAAEHERLQSMLNSPSTFAKHIQSDVSGKHTAVELIGFIPDAMLFTYAPGQPQRTGRSVHAGEAPEVVLDYRPNPAWTPPTIVSEALTGIQGRLWIDKENHHLTRVEGNVFQGVNFGFGVFAHIYPGGTFALEQTPVGQRWIFSSFSEHLTVRALMVKTVKEDSELRSSNFTPIREMNYKEAINLLLSTPLPPR